MHQDRVDEQPSGRCGEQRTEGDDTMSAVAQNYVYQVCGKKETTKKEPVVSKDRLARIKASVDKYLPEKK